MLNTIEYKLEELCLKITDGSHYSPKSVDDGYPMASVKDMYEYGLNIEGCRKILRNDYEKLVKDDCKPLKNDILITKDGATYLKYIFVWRKEIELVLLSSIAILRPKTDLIDPDFLKYYLTNPAVKSDLKNYVSGAAIPRIILKDFKTFKVSIPEIKAQHKIASILSAYDDLIENNTRRIKILEELAQTIYKEWFVNFRFPGYKKVRFVDSPLGRIPEGWERKNLNEIANIIMGQSPKSEFYNSEGFGLPFHQGVTDFGFRSPEHKTFCSVENRIAEKYDILFSVRAPVGRINIANTKLIIGRGLSAIQHKNNMQSFLFYQLKNIFTREDTIGSGAIFNSVTKEDMHNIKIINPNNDIGKKFDELVKPLDLQIENLNSKISNLRKTRDLLLSKLMSGEVKI